MYCTLFFSQAQPSNSGLGHLTVEVFRPRARTHAHTTHTHTLTPHTHITHTTHTRTHTYTTHTTHTTHTHTHSSPHTHTPLTPHTHTHTHTNTHAPTHTHPIGLLRTSNQLIAEAVTQTTHDTRNKLPCPQRDSNMLSHPLQTARPPLSACHVFSNHFRSH